MRQPHFEKGSFRRAIRRQPARLLALIGLGLVFVALFASAATPAPATHFVISGTPTNTTAGDFFSITVTAYDGAEIVDAGYNGTVQFTSTDNGVQTVLPDDYTFTTGEGGDNGTHTFTDLTKLTTAGLQTVTASDGEVEGTSDSITVDPGPADHFDVSSIIDPRTAGEGFNVTLTAQDAFDNTATSYQESHGLAFSGPSTEAPDGTDAEYPASGSFTEGVSDSLSITLYKAEGPITLHVDDDTEGTPVSGDSNSFTVDPAVLDRIVWTQQPSSPQTAGVPFSAEVTAYDEFDNQATNYDGSAATFSGLDPDGSPNGDTPVYGFPATWTNGVASSTTITDYLAETTMLTVTDETTNPDKTVAQDSDSFTVKPNKPDTVEFVQQPTLTQFNTAITPPVTALVKDDFGNPVPHDPPGNPVAVTMSLGSNPGSGTLTGGTPAQNTNASGIATFSGLSINNPGIGYTLVATVPTTYPPAGDRTATSVAFDIANQVSTCTGTCSATGSTPNRNTATVDAFDLGGGAFSSRLGPAASAQSLLARLGMTVAGGTSITLPPNTSCGNLAPIGDPFWITTFESEAGDPPSYKIVARLNKSLSKPGKPGAGKYDICLGTINVNAPPPPGASPGSTGNGCTSPTTSNSWKTKGGSCAKFFNGYYWGLVADYKPSQVNNTTGCPGSSTFPSSPPFNLFPGVYKKQKNNSGDIVHSLCSPSPWDGGGGWR
jgi:hypothetical protein